MGSRQCPYEVDGVPILQYKLEARAWWEGWNARKWWDFDTIIAMHKAILDARKTLKDIDIWYAKVIAERTDNENNQV